MVGEEVAAMKNRSAPPCAVIPVVTYPDVVAAVAWLEAAFGFRVRLRIGDHRTQMWFDSSCLIVGETGEDNQWATKSSVMLRTSDVDRLCAQAQKQGAVVVRPPQKQVYGEYQATLRDFAGHIWTLTQTLEDVDPAVWGGEAVEI
jgi:uncharacterized glyoxalase superfamily protein PhnB